MTICPGSHQPPIVVDTTIGYTTTRRTACPVCDQAVTVYVASPDAFATTEHHGRSAPFDWKPIP